MRYVELGLVFAALLVPVFATLGDFGLTWDEPYYLADVESERAWFGELAEDPRRALSEAEIQRLWRAYSYHNPHPPFYRLASIASAAVLAPFTDPLTAHRGASAVMFAGAGTALYALVRRSHSRFAALLATALWSTTPAVFAHAHFLATEMPMSFLAVAAVLAFELALERRRFALLVGLILGAAFATKFTAVLIGAGLVVWTVARRSLAGAKVLAVATVVAALTAVALTPYWWHHPVQGVATFIEASVSRESHVPIRVAYFGRLYPFHAPAAMPLVLLFICTPLTVVLPATPALVEALARFQRRPSEALWASSVILPIAALMLPRAPNHDGARLLIPTVPFLAALAASGLDRSWRWLVERTTTRGGVPRGRLIPTSIAVAMVGAQAMSTHRYHPFQLSYYNALVGGLRGAAERGLEISYWMDALSPEVIADLNGLLPAGAVVNAPVGDPYYFELLQRLGRLRPDVSIGSHPGATLQLVVSRVAALGYPAMRALEKVPPVYSSSVDGVPLVRLLHFAPGSSLAHQDAPSG